ncbi:MAG: hypothetical protein KF696_15000 [Planctomycetes bacterium]|nr:hypothetical protein [Planctomycetota bacterium]MCW8135875.1 hypothetical protein [Planctomycetota bacterium]
MQNPLPALLMLMLTLAATAAAQDQPWKDAETIDIGAAQTRTVKLEAESYLRVTPATIKTELVEGDEALSLSSWTRLPKGEYRLRVASDAAVKGTLTVRAFADIDEHEPAFDNWRFARKAKPGQTCEVVLFPETDVDYLEFNFDQPGVVEVLQSPAAGPAARFISQQWLSAAGEQVPRDTDGRVALAAGLWILAVASTRSGMDEPLKATITVRHTPLDPLQPGAMRELAMDVKPGAPVAVSLRHGRDAAWFTFEALEDGVVVIERTRTNPDIDVPMTLEQDRGKPALADGGGFVVRRGTCRLRVGPGQGRACELTFVIHFLRDNTEPNAETPTSNLVPGVRAKVLLPTPDDVDSFKVDLAEDTALWLDCTDAKGRVVQLDARWVTAGGDALAVKNVQALKAGSYKLRLQRTDKGLVKEAYTVQLRVYVERKGALKPLADAPKLTPGAARSFVIDPETDGATLQFELPKDGSVFVVIQSSPGVAASSLECEAIVVTGDSDNVKYTPVQGNGPVHLKQGVHRLLLRRPPNSEFNGGLVRVTFVDDSSNVLPPAK